MRFICFIILSIASTAIFAQGNSMHPVSQQNSQNTYALVVGISQYQAGNNIPALKYAHKDAQEFASFLQTSAGGSVPKENIRLLINENATVSAIYLSMRWLTDSKKQNALVYIYFAGHGDKETETIFNLGFLLAYNSPRSNYINNALRIDDLNIFANTLSVTNKDNVVLITDACHSGDVAGKDFRSANLVGNALRTVKNNEVRITSCASDQLSSEDKAWGGGRGVFSWYLVKGLEGFADKDKDGIVTLKDIQIYLDSCFSHDRTLELSNPKQKAVVKGNKNFKLSRVDKNAMTAGMRVMGASRMGTLLKPLPRQPQEYFFDLLKRQPLENLVDFTGLNTDDKKKIPYQVISVVMQELNNKELGKPLEAQNYGFNDSLNLLIKILQDDSDKLQRFNEHLVEMIHNRVQDIINFYLNGDAAELEKREYYNVDGKGYDFLPKMFAVALKLTDPKDALHRIFEVDMNYFSAVVARLKIPAAKDPAPLIDEAMASINKAFALDPYHGAYLHNELGILYTLKKDYKHGEENFLKAIEIAPGWGLPWSNLVLLYTNTDQFEKALDAANKGTALQPGFAGIYLNEGILYQKKDSMLQAEELFRKSIKLNSRHYLPYECLGYLYMKLNRYAEANDFFTAAAERKYSTWQRGVSMTAYPSSEPERMMTGAPCYVNGWDIKTDKLMCQLYLGLTAFIDSNYESAKQQFEQIITTHRSNPIAYHYLANILAIQQHKQEAETMYQMAMHYHLDDRPFNHYCDSLASNLDSNNSKDCIVLRVQQSNYNKLDDLYSLATLYATWNHFSEAEAMYRKIINSDSSQTGTWKSLASMLEKIHRFKDAEEAWLNYTRLSTDDKALTDFYERMVSYYPEVPEWYYKGGALLYKAVAHDADVYHYGDGGDIDIDQSTSGNQILFTDTTGNSVIKINHAKEAIGYFSEAGRLSQQDDDAIIDISSKLGDLYAWSDFPEKAARYYKNALDLEPGNAGTRIKYINALSHAWHLSEAMQQSDILYNQEEINFSMQKNLAAYCIEAGRFARADTLLKSLEAKMIVEDPELPELNGSLELLSNHYQQALPIYKNLLMKDSNNVSTMYTLATIYAKLNNTTGAWKMLQAAVDNGFRYNYVLELDPTWKLFRSSPEWAKIQPIQNNKQKEKQ